MGIRMGMGMSWPWWPSSHSKSVANVIANISNSIATTSQCRRFLYLVNLVCLSRRHSVQPVLPGRRTDGHFSGAVQSGCARADINRRYGCLDMLRLTHKILHINIPHTCMLLGETISYFTFCMFPVH